MPHKNKEDERRNKEQYYKNNREKIKERKRELYLLHSNEVKGRVKQWAKDNPEKVREYKKKWQENNPEYNNEYQRKWMKTKNGKANNQRGQSKRRARERLLINTLTAEEWIDILKEYKFKCAYCGCEFTLFNKETRDHVIPISKGGDNVKENIVPACQSCNSKKHDKILLKGIKP